MNSLRYIHFPLDNTVVSCLIQYLETMNYKCEVSLSSGDNVRCHNCYKDKDYLAIDFSHQHK